MLRKIRTELSNENPGGRNHILLGNIYMFVGNSVHGVTVQWRVYRSCMFVFSSMHHSCLKDNDGNAPFIAVFSIHVVSHSNRIFL